MVCLLLLFVYVDADFNNLSDFQAESCTSAPLVLNSSFMTCTVVASRSRLWLMRGAQNCYSTLCNIMYQINIRSIIRLLTHVEMLLNQVNKPISIRHG